ADLYLACACKEGHPAALVAFDRVHLARVPEYLARMHAAPDFCDDVRQILSEKLLVASRDAAPRIAEYSGRGSLAAWLRIAAVRTALNLRAQRREEPEESGYSFEHIFAAARASTEVEYLRKRYAHEFTLALRAAFAALSPDQRLVLRLHLVK